MNQGNLFAISFIIFIIIMIIISALKPPLSKDKEMNNPRYVSELFTDTDGCTYKIIKPSNSNYRMGVVLVGCNQ